MGQRYSFHFRIFENKGGKKFFFSGKKQQKKKGVGILFLDAFPIGIFTIWLSPIRTVNVFRTRKLVVLGGEFAVLSCFFFS